MAREIEKKFLVRGTNWQLNAKKTRIQQGYLCRTPYKTVRVRRADNEAFLTIKGATTGFSRAEFEYAIPVEDATELLALCEPGLIDKTRYSVQVDAHTWDVDVFHGVNDGLIIAEIELSSETEAFTKPAWLGKDVTGDPKYYNARLSQRPYSSWSVKEREGA